MGLGAILANPWFYRAMHYSAKSGLACRLSVCLPVCDVGGSSSHVENLGN